MIKRTAILMTTAFMFVTLPGAAVADDQDRDRDCIKDKQQLKDGSCLDYSTDMSGRFIVSDGQDQLRDGTGDGVPDRLRDGSCLDYSTVSVNMILG